jgi:hypothetical protein
VLKRREDEARKRIELARLAQSTLDREQHDAAGDDEAF